jgi:hypothetical protein
LLKKKYIFTSNILQKGCIRLAAASDKVYQFLALGRWFSPASSTTKTGRHDIAEILLKVALKHTQKITNRFVFVKLPLLCLLILKTCLIEICPMSFIY